MKKKFKSWSSERSALTPLAVAILLCTGLVQTDRAVKLLDGGAAGLLRKPFRMNELWYAVINALQPEE